jgi:threonine/homoserine/homoserine lactone efflux protein
MLPDYPQFILFLTATILLNLTPGNDVIYIAGQSLDSTKKGIFAALGISVGACIYILATAFGLSEIFRHAPLVFDLVKIIGGVYLLYLAWKVFSSRSKISFSAGDQQKSLRKSFYRGIFTNLLNPKVGIFFITFLPQFTDSARGKIWLQLLSLGACFVLSGTLVNLIYALLISQCRSHLFSKPYLQLWLNKVTGLLFCVLAFKVLTSKQS